MNILVPVLVVAAIFFVSYFSDWIAAKGKSKIVDQDLRVKAADLAAKELDLKRQIVDFERAKLEQLNQLGKPASLTKKEIEVEYEELEDKRVKK